MIRPNDPDLPNLQELEEDVSSYVKMRVDSAKLGLVDSMSRICGNGLSAVIALLIGSVALTVLSVALLLLMSKWVDSYILGAVILGGFYLIAALVVWLLRGKFVDRMVGVFARMIFSTHEHDQL